MYPSPTGEIIQLAQDNGFNGLTFCSTKKDVVKAFESFGAKGWIVSICILIANGMSMEQI